MLFFSRRFFTAFGVEGGPQEARRLRSRCGLGVWVWVVGVVGGMGGRALKGGEPCMRRPQPGGKACCAKVGRGGDNGLHVQCRCSHHASDLHAGWEAARDAGGLGHVGLTDIIGDIRVGGFDIGRWGMGGALRSLLPCSPMACTLSHSFARMSLYSWRCSGVIRQASRRVICGRSGGSQPEAVEAPAMGARCGAGQMQRIKPCALRRHGKQAGLTPRMNSRSMAACRSITNLDAGSAANPEQTRGEDMAGGWGGGATCGSGACLGRHLPRQADGLHAPQHAWLQVGMQLAAGAVGGWHWTCGGVSHMSGQGSLQGEARGSTCTPTRVPPVQ